MVRVTSTACERCWATKFITGNCCSKQRSWTPSSLSRCEMSDRFPQNLSPAKNYGFYLPLKIRLTDHQCATRDLMLFIYFLSKVYYCPPEDNRQVNGSYRSLSGCRSKALALLSNFSNLAFANRIHRFGASKHSFCCDEHLSHELAEYCFAPLAYLVT